MVLVPDRDDISSLRQAMMMEKDVFNRLASAFAAGDPCTIYNQISSFRAHRQSDTIRTNLFSNIHPWLKYFSNSSSRLCAFVVQVPPHSPSLDVRRSMFDVLSATSCSIIHPWLYGGRWAIGAPVPFALYCGKINPRQFVKFVSIPCVLGVFALKVRVHPWLKYFSNSSSRLCAFVVQVPPHSPSLDDGHPWLYGGRWAIGAPVPFALYCGKINPRQFVKFVSKFPPFFFINCVDIFQHCFKLVASTASRGGARLAGKNIFNRGRCSRDSGAVLLDWGCGCFQTLVWAFPGGMGCKVRRVQTRLVNICDH
jgi:hypothetical protein